MQCACFGIRIGSDMELCCEQSYASIELHSGIEELISKGSKAGRPVAKERGIMSTEMCHSIVRH